MLEGTLTEPTKNYNSQPIRLSQQHLNILENCPRYFQRVYLEKRPALVPQEVRARAEWGTRFHLLMQQKELGLAIEPLLTEDLEMKSSIEALLSAIQDIFDRQTKIVREAEHSRLLAVGKYLFNAIYDLLILTPNKAEILDWKTYPQPEKTYKLAGSWQTRLYLYILAETSHYEPEQISFTYWFVKLPQEPQKITFQYNSQLHQQNHRDLMNLLSKVDEYLKGILIFLSLVVLTVRKIAQ
jgi:hypothetical protein